MQSVNIGWGALEVRAEGTVQKIDVVLAIRNAVIKDYKALNNMLAFINTLPGLLTLNPPQYHSEGLPVRETSAALEYSNQVMNLDSFLIDSNELIVCGKGLLDFNDNTTDMTFRLVSGGKRNISRIPVLGFILEGKEENTAVALTAQGDMYDPEVSHTAAQELLAYPFNVLARVFIWPVNRIQRANENEADMTGGIRNWIKKPEQARKTMIVM
jgi:hypothetical protein